MLNFISIAAIVLSVGVLALGTEREQYQVKVDRNRRVPMRDGTELAADVYRPDAHGRFPVVLTRTPYGREQGATAAHFAQHGYVFVSIDVRGRGDSGGEFVPWRNEGLDGFDSIEWCAGQPWSNGEIGTTGLSYAAYDQWLAAIQRPPHLRAMFVHSPMADPFVDIWLSGPGGLPTPMQIGWFYRTSGRNRPDMTAIDWRRVYDHVPLYTLDEETGHKIAAWKEVVDHSQLTSWWDAMRYQNQYDRVQVPIFHLSGWYDDTLIATPLNFVGMSSTTGHQPQYMMIGPWIHSNNLTSRIGQLDFGQSARLSTETLELEWFDHWLRHVENGIQNEKPVRVFAMGKNEWLEDNQWPLSDTKPTKYYFHSSGAANSSLGDGSLSAVRPSREAPDRYVYDPETPVPFITDATFSQLGGPDDYGAVEKRRDVLVYTSEQLSSDVLICGSVTAKLYAASSAADTDFMAKLIDVWPNGYAQRLNDGMMRARFRNGADRPSLIQPNRPYAYDLNLWATCQLVAKGHGIRIEVSSSAFPKYDRNPNLGEPLGKTTRWSKAAQTVFHDTNRPSYVVLPIVHGEDRR